MENKKGKLITIEGTDAVGKNTQSRKLKKYLEDKGEKVVSFEFPRYNTFIGQIIAKYLKGEYGSIEQVPSELICTVYAADRKNAQDEIKKYLDEGYYVVCDRYTHSNLFSAAKLPEDKWDEFITWIEKLEFEGFNIIKPDITFYLYVDINTTINRIESRGKRDYQNGKEDIHESNKELLLNTSRCYLKYGENRPSNKWININQIKNGKQMDQDSVFNLIISNLEQI